MIGAAFLIVCGLAVLGAASCIGLLFDLGVGIVRYVRTRRLLREMRRG